MIGGVDDQEVSMTRSRTIDEQRAELLARGQGGGVTRRHGPAGMLTTAQVAEWFGVCAHTVLSWGNDGHLTYLTTASHHGCARWYRQADVEALAAAGPIRFLVTPAGTLADYVYVRRDPWR